MHLFGLTGGIASGKSLVAARFRARGLAVLDADQVARAVVEPGTAGLSELVARFGLHILTDAGALDRKRLGAIAFAEPDARRALNAIVHPRIAARTQELRAALESEGHDVACYEAALLVENGLSAAFQPLVVVIAAPDLQRRRLMQRDALDAVEADQRLAAQAPLEAKIAAAAFLLRNEGSLPELEAEADRVLDAVCAQLGVPRRTA